MWRKAPRFTFAGGEDFGSFGGRRFESCHAAYVEHVAQLAEQDRRRSYPRRYFERCQLTAGSKEQLTWHVSTYSISVISRVPTRALRPTISRQNSSSAGRCLPACSGSRSFTRMASRSLAGSRN